VPRPTRSKVFPSPSIPPTTAAKQVKETSCKPGKSHDAELPEFHEMAGLLNRMMEDIAKR